MIDKLKQWFTRQERPKATRDAPLKEELWRKIEDHEWRLRYLELQRELVDRTGADQSHS